MNADKMRFEAAKTAMAAIIGKASFHVCSESGATLPGHAVYTNDEGREQTMQAITTGAVMYADMLLKKLGH